jgi:hypothetical protein
VGCCGGVTDAEYPDNDTFCIPYNDEKYAMIFSSYYNERKEISMFKQKLIDLCKILVPSGKLLPVLKQYCTIYFLSNSSPPLDISKIDFGGTIGNQNETNHSAFEYRPVHR